MQIRTQALQEGTPKEADNTPAFFGAHALGSAFAHFVTSFIIQSTIAVL